MPRYEYMPFRPVRKVESILKNLSQICFLLLLLAEYHTVQISPAGAVVTLCLEWITGCPGVPASSPAIHISLHNLAIEEFSLYAPASPQENTTASC